MNLRTKWLRRFLLPGIALVVAASALPGFAQRMDLNTVGEPVQPMPVDPAIRFTEWRENFHHQQQNVRMVNGVQYGDLPQFVDFHYVGKVARLNGTTMVSLATAPPPPADVKVVVSKLDNNSTLEWKNGPGAPKDTHYIVVWRPTAAPDWTRQIDAAQLAHLHAGAYQKKADGSYVVTVPVSKDNAIFGVEAVGAHGQRSTAVVPMPTR